MLAPVPTTLQKIMTDNELQTRRNRDLVGVILVAAIAVLAVAQIMNIGDRELVALLREGCIVALLLVVCFWPRRKKPLS